MLKNMDENSIRKELATCVIESFVPLIPHSTYINRYVVASCSEFRLLKNLK